MNKTCDACGANGAGYGYGGMRVCCRCNEMLREEIGRLQDNGEGVNVHNIIMHMARTHHQWPNPIASS